MMKKIILLTFCLLPIMLLAQSALDYFHTAANYYVNANKKNAQTAIREGIQKFPNDPKLNNLAAKIEDLPDPENSENQNQQQQQQNQDHKEDQKKEQQQQKQDQQQQRQQQQQDKRQLDALQQNERQTQKKVAEEEMKKGGKIKQEKDW
jgi:Skp family chaperone for outer membrane proteins